MRLSRKDFLQSTLSFAILGLLAPGCGDDDESGTASGATSSTSSTTGATSSSDASSTTSSTSGTGGSGQGGSGQGGSGQGGSGQGGSGQGGSGQGGSGQGGAGGGASASCLDNGTNVTIAGNHAHALVVSKDDIAAGIDKTYDIMGGSAHTHSVTVTAADFALLASNTTVMITSTQGSQHTHVCTITCA